MAFFRIILIVFIGSILSSCSPVYKVAHDYTPPKSQKGLVCLKGCESKRSQCNLQCDRNYSQCSIKAERQAKKNLPALLQAYPEKLEIWLDARDAYLRDLDWYEFQLDIYESRRARYIDRCIDGGKKKYSCHRSFHRLHRPLIHDRPYFDIPRPRKPTLASEAARIRKLNCNEDCGCDSKYRLCYTSCGGVVKSKKICIKNCP